MGILRDIFLPWLSLRDARRSHEKAAGAYRSESIIARQSLRTAHGREDEAHLRLTNAEIEINRLRKLVANGHFRNPATGRLGRKGETF